MAAAISIPPSPPLLLLTLSVFICKFVAPVLDLTCNPIKFPVYIDNVSLPFLPIPVSVSLKNLYIGFMLLIWAYPVALPKSSVFDAHVKSSSEMN